MKFQLVALYIFRFINTEWNWNCNLGIETSFRNIFNRSECKFESLNLFEFCVFLFIFCVHETHRNSLAGVNSLFLMRMCHIKPIFVQINTNYTTFATLISPYWKTSCYEPNRLKKRKMAERIKKLFAMCITKSFIMWEKYILRCEKSSLRWR